MILFRDEKISLSYPGQLSYRPILGIVCPGQLSYRPILGIVCPGQLSYSSYYRGLKISDWLHGLSEN